MSKRILIFSPELRNRTELGELMQRYAKEYFAGYNLEIQIFYGLGQPKKEEQIGHGGEVFVIFDRRIFPVGDSRGKSFKLNSEERTKFNLIKMSYELSKKICDEHGIPYLIYEGEIRRGIGNYFVNRIHNVKGQILSKLETAFEI